MAVPKDWRGRGAGRALLETVTSSFSRGATAWLHTRDAVGPTHAIGFYERAGFHAVGELFMDAGIPHSKDGEGADVRQKPCRHVSLA